MPFIWQDDLAVMVEEVLKAGLKIKSGKAPGPDDVAGVVVKDTMRYLALAWAKWASGCLREGHFPRDWKGARLVLIMKPGKLDLSPSSYKPICLLSDAGKLFERVMIRRLHAFLDASEGWRTASLVFDWVCHEILRFNFEFAVDLPGPLPPSFAQSLGHGDSFGASYRQHWWPRRATAMFIRDGGDIGCLIWCSDLGTDCGRQPRDLEGCA